ncbi:MAG: acyltransferase family protein [Xanthobacteraceae bacterium]
MNERRYPSLEGLRFLASLAIVLYHFVPYTERGRTSAEFWSGQFSIAVDLFFVISGIVIANGYIGRISNWREYCEFVRRRLARLYPLHLATLGFYVVVGAAASAGLVSVVKESKYAFSELWSNLLLVHAWGFSSQLSFNYVSWSISAELFVYLLFPLIAWMATRPSGLIAVGAVLAASITISHSWIGRSLPHLTWDYSILRALPSFSLGVWICANRNLVINVVGLRRAAAGLAFSVVLLAMLMAVGSSEYALLGAVYCIVVFAFLCDVGQLRTPLAWDPISRLGILTYSIYMLHPLVATVLLSFLAPRLLGTSFWATVAAIGAAIAVTFGAAVLSYRWFEEPARQMLTSSPRGLRLAQQR